MFSLRRWNHIASPLGNRRLLRVLAGLYRSSFIQYQGAKIIRLAVLSVYLILQSQLMRYETYVAVDSRPDKWPFHGDFFRIFGSICPVGASLVLITAQDNINAGGPVRQAVGTASHPFCRWPRSGNLIRWIIFNSTLRYLAFAIPHAALLIVMGMRVVTSFSKWLVRMRRPRYWPCKFWASSCGAFSPQRRMLRSADILPWKTRFPRDLQQPSR